MADQFRVAGFDPSLRHWGVALGVYTPANESLRITHVDCIEPVVSTGKQVRQNSIDLECASQLFRTAQEVAKNAHAVFVEVPVGSRSARAMCSYGVCVGVLAALRQLGMPIFEQTADEVKLAGFGSKKATKEQMIDWAVRAHPEAKWPTRIVKGETSIIAGKAEHMADAVACIHAGIVSYPFRQLMSLRAA